MASETIKHQQTTLSGSESGLVVDVLYSDAADLNDAKEFARLHLQLRTLQYPRLSEARLEALVRMRELLNSEIEAIQFAEKRGNQVVR